MAVLREYLATEVEFVSRVIPDERAGIAAALREMAAQGACLICTTGARARPRQRCTPQQCAAFNPGTRRGRAVAGGTGPAPHDVTPEAMADVCDKMLPGFGEVRLLSERPTPHACAGLRSC